MVRLCVRRACEDRQADGGGQQDARGAMACLSDGHANSPGIQGQVFRKGCAGGAQRDASRGSPRATENAMTTAAPRRCAAWRAAPGSGPRRFSGCRRSRPVRALQPASVVEPDIGADVEHQTVDPVVALYGLLDRIAQVLGVAAGTGPVPPFEPTMPLPSPAPMLKASLPACASAFIVTLLATSLLGLGESSGFCGMSCGLSIGLMSSSIFFGSGGFSLRRRRRRGQGRDRWSRAALRDACRRAAGKCQTRAASSRSATVPSARPEPCRRRPAMDRSSESLGQPGRRLAGDQADLRQVHATQQSRTSITFWYWTAESPFTITGKFGIGALCGRRRCSSSASVTG